MGPAGTGREEGSEIGLGPPGPAGGVGWGFCPPLCPGGWAPGFIGRSPPAPRKPCSCRRSASTAALMASSPHTAGGGWAWRDALGGHRDAVGVSVTLSGSVSPSVLESLPISYAPCLSSCASSSISPCLVLFLSLRVSAHCFPSLLASLFPPPWVSPFSGCPQPCSICRGTPSPLSAALALSSARLPWLQPRWPRARPLQ